MGVIKGLGCLSTKAKLLCRDSYPDGSISKYLEDRKLMVRE